MSNTSRVDKTLFEESHYLGKPADSNDLLVQRRIRILEKFEGYFDQNADLVEIGCGNGNTILQISGRFRHSYGLEYALVHESEYNELKSDLQIKNSEFRVWDIMSQGFEPQCNRLLSFEVIEHLPDESGVKNYANSVISGSLAAISVPNKWWIFETHGASLPLLPWNRVPFFSWLPTFIHEKFALARIYTKPRIKKLMEEAGFEVLEMHYVMAPMDVIKWRPLQQFLRKYIFNSDTTKIPFKAVSIMVFCKKK